VNLKKKSPLPLTAFRGTYRNELYGTLTVSAPRQDEAAQYDLDVRFQHHTDVVGKLDYLDGNEFRLWLNNPRFGIFPVTFSTKAGQVDSIVLTDTDFVDQDRYIFKKEP
jgi:hypothetical protein